MCAKSPWHPSDRREHAFAGRAVDAGVHVTFVEPPRDVRSIGRGSVTRYARGLTGHLLVETPPGLTVVARSTPVPGHRNRVAGAFEGALGRYVLGAYAPNGAPTVTNLPWHWTSSSGRGRRVFDCADDWTRLYPEARRPRLLDLFRRVADEADEVIVASSDLGYLFPGRTVVHVPNGADASDVAHTPAPQPLRRSAVYVGTLSERFDAATVAGVVGALPEWTLDIFGPCRYAGLGDRPSKELESLVVESHGRVRLRGPVPRSEVATTIDNADVVLVPNVAHLSVGQSSMKLFDSAARGRPTVVASGVTSNGADLPPATVVATTLDDWISGILRSLDEPAGLAEERIAWARANTWQHRWPAWSGAVFGGMAGRREES